MFETQVGGFQPTVKRPKAFPVHRDNLDHNEMKAMLKEDERNFKDAVDAFIEKYAFALNVICTCVAARESLSR